MDSGKTGTHTTTRRGMTAREAWLAWAACAAVSAALVFLCSSTSPLFSIMSDDSSIFLVVGKYWREGWLPYRDLWDSKGPFLFLVNAIGYSITSSPLGVALLQVVFMSATLFFTYKLLRCEFGAGRSALAAFGVFCTLAYVYGSGDTAIGPLLRRDYRVAGACRESGLTLFRLCEGAPGEAGAAVKILTWRRPENSRWRIALQNGVLQLAKRPVSSPETRRFATRRGASCNSIDSQ